MKERSHFSSIKRVGLQHTRRYDRQDGYDVYTFQRRQPGSTSVLQSTRALNTELIKIFVEITFCKTKLFINVSFLKTFYM